MARLASPHTQSLLITALAAKGEWSGRRKGVHLKLTLDRQADLEGRRVIWTAYIVGDHRRQRAGRAGTVFEALSQIESILRVNKFLS